MVLKRFFGNRGHSDTVASAGGNYKKAPAFFAALALFAATSPLFALQVPKLQGRVNDYAKIMKDSDKREIETYLKNLEDQTSVQMAVLTIPSLEGQNISSFGIKVADAWKLGAKDKDNGAILIVSMKDHDLRIEVGYGLEGQLTDAKCGLIIRNIIIPKFRQGNYSAGILEGIKTMGGIAAGDAEITNSKALNQDEDEDEVPAIVVLVVMIWLIFVFFGILSSRGRRRRFGPAIFFMPPINTGHRPTNFSSGRSSFSGSSFGGGFSGFSGGGGHFGGGGASGHW